MSSPSSFTTSTSTLSLWGFSSRPHVQYYRSVASGRWLPHAEAAVVVGTALDGGHAMNTANEAAQVAVAVALEPLIAVMETELQEATAERDRIVERERPRGLVGWLHR